MNDKPKIITTPVMGYVEPELKERMDAIKDVKPRFTLSYQVEACLEVGLPIIEERVGIKRKKR